MTARILAWWRGQVPAVRWAVGLGLALVALLVVVRLLGAAGGLLVGLLGLPAAYQRAGATRDRELAAEAARRAAGEARVSAALAQREAQAARARAEAQALADAEADRAIAAAADLHHPPADPRQVGADLHHPEPAFLRQVRERGGRP